MDEQKLQRNLVERLSADIALELDLLAQTMEFSDDVRAKIQRGADEIKRLEAALAAERERCAKAAEEFLTRGRSPHGRSVAEAIRKA